MGDLEGKVILVTGASSGIGRATALELARRGARVQVACRSRTKTQSLLDEIDASGGRAEFFELELADLESVRTCAKKVLDSGVPLHVLINNAGVAGRRGLTKQGFELAFGVNHLGPFLLTLQLLPKLFKESHSRVVNVSSKAHYAALGVDYEAQRRKTTGITGLHAYEVSKLANVLHAKELARRYADSGLHAYSLHPGVVATDVWRHVPRLIQPLLKWRMLDENRGALTSLFCATSPEVASQNGLYYDECKVKEPSAVAQDAPLARELWERSLAWTSA